jgi:hypothetical protein
MIGADALGISTIPAQISLLNGKSGVFHPDLGLMGSALAAAPLVVGRR